MPAIPAEYKRLRIIWAIIEEGGRGYGKNICFKFRRWKNPSAEECLNDLVLQREVKVHNGFYIFRPEGIGREYEDPKYGNKYRR